MFLIITFLLALFFLTGVFFLTAQASAFRRIHKKDSKKQIIAAGNWFFYRPFHHYFLPQHEHEGLFFATVCAQNISRYCYTACAVIFLLATPLFHAPEISLHYETATLPDGSVFWIILSIVFFILFSFLVGDYFPRMLGMRLPEKTLHICPIFSSLFMLLAFPITFLLLKISLSFSRSIYFDQLYEPQMQAKQEIIDIIQEAELSPNTNKDDKQLIKAVLSFCKRIAREIMVPRVNIFSLPADTSIREAARLISAEGYSRIPIYRGSIDEIVGVLMYKDLLAKFVEWEDKGGDSKILDAPIETLQKNVFYTPETNKISNLLQEFRKKKVHLAIVVDEYGGTEGIVSIEDILEEIVGDISDEYDEVESLYIVQPDGSWIVDAQMSILDAEELLGVKIPQEGDYDTIGGYVFHCTGSIPSKGFKIHQDTMELEVLGSNERVIEKVRIKPVHHSKSHSNDEEEM